MFVGQVFWDSMATPIDDLLVTALTPFQPFGVDLGLDRLRALMMRLGDPQGEVPIVHIAGTNGKGSVCAYVAQILTEAGYRTGRFTSPHLVDWTERMTVNGEAIARSHLVDLIHRVTAAADPQDMPTQFEVITAAAWLFFAGEKVDVAVMEVGLGGRLDATNLKEDPLVTVLTSISRDHWQRLGPTLGDIAREKVGIFKPQRPAVVGPLPAEAVAVVEDRTAALPCPLQWVASAEPRGDRTWFYPPLNLTYTLGLSGTVQGINSALAIAVAQQLRDQGWRLPEGAIVQGLAKTQWAGRLQWCQWQGRSLLLDGAHNEASAAVLRQYADSLYRPITWIVGMLNTKDHGAILGHLLRSGDRLWLVPVPDHQSADLDRLAHLARSLCGELADCQIGEDLFPVLDRLDQEPADYQPVLCGSLYLLGYFLRQQREDLPQIS